MRKVEAKSSPKGNAILKGGPMKARKSTSRCAAVRQVEKIKPSRTQSGGLFAHVDMKNRKTHKVNEILQLAEMMSGENTAYKRTLLMRMRKSGVRVGKYAHDCSCVVKDEFEGKGLCETAYLDGFHKKKHVCKTPAIRYKKTLNSQACEQLWSRMDKMTGLKTMSRSHYRFFLRHYCSWRNAYSLHDRLRSDTTPLLSARKMRKRGRISPRRWLPRVIKRRQKISLAMRTVKNKNKKKRITVMKRLKRRHG